MCLQRTSPSKLATAFHKTKTEYCCFQNYFFQGKCLSLLHPSLWYKQVKQTYFVVNEIKQQGKREPWVWLSTIIHFLGIVRSFGCHDSVFPWKSKLEACFCHWNVQRKSSALEINQAALKLKTSPPTASAKIDCLSFSDIGVRGKKYTPRTISTLLCNERYGK